MVMTADGDSFTQRDLVSDVPGLAELLDPVVKNPWGIAFGPVATPTPLWVNNKFAPTRPGDPAVQRGDQRPTVPVQKIALEVARRRRSAWSSTRRRTSRSPRPAC